MGFIKELREFAVKGNVMDLAIGVVIGAAFAKIISSVVDYLIMPLIGIIFRGSDFKDWVLRVRDAEIKYGMFFSACLDFLVVAFVLFLVMKTVNRFRKQEAAIPVPVSRQEELLAEIRDLLKNKNRIE